MSEKLLCEIFRSSRKEEMYLYVDKRKGLVDVPEALMATFGKPVPVLTMILTEEKSLARVAARDVMAAIEEQGFYLQMPPPRSRTCWTCIALNLPAARDDARMNFLAHAWLARPGNDGFLYGNLIADGVKGRDLSGWPTSVADGIRHHRRVDAWVDQHPGCWLPVIGLPGNSAAMPVLPSIWCGTTSLPSSRRVNGSISSSSAVTSYCRPGLLPNGWPA